MLRHVSTQARQFIALDFLAPVLLLPKRHLHSTTAVRKPQAEQPPSSTKKSYFPSSPLTFITSLGQNGPQNRSNFSAESIEQFNQTIVEIRRTLNDSPSKHHRLLELWEQINSLKILPFLGRAQIGPLSKNMIETFLEPYPMTSERLAQEREEDSGEEDSEGLHGRRRIDMSGLDPLMKKFVQNVTIIAARSDYWDAMLALMWYHIREGDALAILELYKKFMSLVGEKDVEMDQAFQNEVILGSEEDYRGIDETDLAVKLKVPPEPAGYVHVLMAVVTAHAMKGSFHGALETCLATVVQFDREQVLAFTNQALAHDLELKSQVKKYLFRLILARQLSKPAEFVQFIKRLSVKKSILELSDVYKTIKSGLFGSDAFLAADPSLVTAKKTIALTNVVWTTILSAFIKCGKKDMAGHVWNGLTESGITPGISMWTAMLDAYGSVGAVKDGLAAWDLMLQQGVKPESLTYRAIINILFKGQRPDLAMELFRQYESLPVDDQEHRLSVYNTVLAGLCRSNREGEAEKIRIEMQEKGLKPNEVTFNTLIHHYGIRRNFRSMAAILRAMEAVGFEGDDYTFTTILNALHKAGHKNAAELVLAMMEKRGVKQKNVVLYTSLINHQLIEGREENVRVAMKILASLEEDPRNLPTEVTYTGVLCGLYRLGWMDPGELREIETRILNKMRERGLSLGLPGYHLLLKACLVNPHKDGVEQAMAHYAEMKAREIPIVGTTYYIMLAGLLQRREWAFADKIVEEMYEAGIFPTGSLSRLVDDINNRRVGA